MKRASTKHLLSFLGALLWALALVLTACMSENDQVAGGGEDFPNTVQPVGEVASSDISSHTAWDQFQGIPTPPDVHSIADSLSVPILLKSAAQTVQAAQVAQISIQGTDTAENYTVERVTAEGDSLQVSFRVLAGPDHNLSTTADNEVSRYERLLTRDGDTLEWTLLTSADADSVLWGPGDSGTVMMQYQKQSPLSKPEVSQLSVTLTAKIYNRGDSSVLLSYREQDLLNNGTQVVFLAQGIHGDSSLVLGDTALVTVNQTPSPSADAPLLTSSGRYFITLAAQPWNFKDNALLYYTFENHWRSNQILRHSFLNFMPDSAVISGRLDIHGHFTYSFEDEQGDSSTATGAFENDSIQMDLQQVQGGKTENYRLIYDVNGNLTSEQSLSP